MGRRATIDRLPTSQRALVDALRAEGATIEQIQAALERGGVSLSRSAVGRYVQRLDASGPAGVGRELVRLRKALRGIEEDLGEVRRLLTAGPPLTVVEVVEPDGAAEGAVERAP